MAKLQSDITLADFVKLTTGQQVTVLKQPHEVFEKYDGVKISVVYNPFIDSKEFFDHITVSYKGFEIFPFEKIGTVPQESYGYIQFSKIWDILKFIEAEIKNFAGSELTEFLFEFIMRKNTIPTEYKRYHKMILVGSRRIKQLSNKLGMVTITPKTNEERFSLHEAFKHTCVYPNLIFTGTTNPSAILSLAYNLESELGGKAEGIVLKSNFGVSYKVVDPEKRTKQYRREKTAKYFFHDPDQQRYYEEFVEGEATRLVSSYCQFPDMEKNSFKKMLETLFYYVYGPPYSYSVISRGHQKHQINIKDDVYVKVRNKMIKKYMDFYGFNYKVDSKTEIKPTHQLPKALFPSLVRGLPGFNYNVDSKTEIKTTHPLPKASFPSLLLVRGLPGSGKSTLASAMVESSKIKTYHYEADQFFTDENGEYKFIRDEITDAHNWCFTNAIKALKNGHSVIVANTFVNYKEIEKYFLFCLDNNIKFDIIEAHGNYGSVHNVPDYAIERMKGKWESLASIKETMKNETFK